MTAAEKSTEDTCERLHTYSVLSVELQEVGCSWEVHVSITSHPLEN